MLDDNLGVARRQNPGYSEQAIRGLDLGEGRPCRGGQAKLALRSANRTSASISPRVSLRPSQK